MIIKTFKAPTLKEAMANAKAELGEEAVLLHQKETKKGGLLGFGGKSIVEIIVAVEEVQAHKPERSATPRKGRTRTPRPATVGRVMSPNQPQAPVEPRVPVSNPVQMDTPVQPVVSRKTAASQYQTAGTQQSVDDAQVRADLYDAGQNHPSFSDILSSLGTINKADDEIFGLDAALSDTVATTDTAESVSRPPRIIRPMEKKATTVQTSQPEKEPEAVAQVETDQGTIQSLQNELEEMKEALARMSTEKHGDGEITLQQAMLDCDVDDRVIKDMVRKLTGSEILSDKNSDKAHKSLEKYLKKTVRVASGITLLSNKPKIVALIGPTGVGKTTTLAKIAAKFVLEMQVSTALITADTYRISAVEQLKTYSDILGLPLEIVYSSDALQQAIKKHSDKKLILIDTAGRSQYNDFQMKELCDLLSGDSDIEKHLVLSSTTKNRDAEEILAKFGPCQPERVIFTKTDETSSLGLLLNLLYKRKIALSYVTNGQSVPDDIIPASFGKLADMLLR